MSILSNRRMEFLKTYIEGELRGYDWFRGVKVSMSEWKYKDLVLPCYDINIDSGDYPMYTEFIETASLYAYARLCKLRLDPQAQKEIRDYATELDVMLRIAFPKSWAALMNDSWISQGVSA